MAIARTMSNLSSRIIMAAVSAQSTAPRTNLLLLTCLIRRPPPPSPTYPGIGVATPVTHVPSARYDPMNTHSVYLPAFPSLPLSGPHILASVALSYPSTPLGRSSRVGYCYVHRCSESRGCLLSRSRGLPWVLCCLRSPRLIIRCSDSYPYPFRGL